MSKTIGITIEPKMLKWARESIGLSPEVVAKKMRRKNIGVDTILLWEVNKTTLTLGQLKALASIYKRPLTAFFLPSPPRDYKPKDFRAMGEVAPFAPETLLVIRKTRRIQKIYVELSEMLDVGQKKERPRANVKQDPEEICREVRKHLGISISEQFEWKNSAVAFSRWIEVLEKDGILILQMSIPENILALSLIEDVPTIVINTQGQPTRRKIFSLFHEYFHILLATAGVCNMQERINDISREGRIERFCNFAAGSFLVPKEQLLKHNLVYLHREMDWDEDTLKSLADTFKVSRETVLRRLHILGKTTLEFYQKKRDEWSKVGKTKKSNWGLPPPKKSIRMHGNLFTSCVLQAYDNEFITLADVVSYLNVKVKHVQEIRDLITI